MSIDNSGVTADSPTVETGGDQEQAQDQARVSEDDKTQADNASKVSESVPYNRFKEKVDELNSLKEELESYKSSQSQTHEEQSVSDKKDISGLEDNSILSSIVEQAKTQAKEEIMAEIYTAVAEQDKIANEQSKQVESFRKQFVNDEELQGFVSYAKDLKDKFGNNIDVQKVYEQWDQEGRPVSGKSATNKPKKSDVQSASTSKNPSLVEIAKEAIRKRGG